MNRLESPSKDLLLEDYRYLADSFWKNEQTGETRVNLFIGLVTLVVGALVGLMTYDNGPDGETLRPVVIVAFAALFVLGIITLARMLTRNENTDRYKRGLDTIRQTFKDHFDGDHVLLHYYPIEGPGPDKKDSDDHGARKGKTAALKDWLQQSKKEIKLRKFGGLAHTVAAINSLMVAGIAGAFVYPLADTPPDPCTAPAGGHVPTLIETYCAAVIAFAFAFVIQLLYVALRGTRAKKALREGAITHSGGVVYKVENGTAKYLLVRPTDRSDEWVLPKGHVRRGEGHGEAALREVREETGIFARLICLIDRVEFEVETRKDGETETEHVRAKFYLMQEMSDSKKRQDGGPEEVGPREQDWFSADEALQELSYPESKHVLQAAERKRIALYADK